MTVLFSILLDNWQAVMASIAAIAAFAFGRSKKKQGRKQVQDELQDAYNTTTKELHNVKTKRSADPDAVLDSLRQYAKRGQGGGDS